MLLCALTPSPTDLPSYLCTTPRLLASLVAGVTDPATAEGGDDRVDDRAPAYVAISRHRFGDLGPEPETFG